MTGERIKTIRTRLKMRQQEFAALLNINPSAISQMESNRIKPSLDTLLQITQIFGIDLHWLLTGSGSMFVNSKIQGMEPAKLQLDELQTMLNDKLNDIIQTKEEILRNDVLEIRVSGEIAAGLPVETISSELDVVAVKRSMIRGSVDDFICLKVNGHSMEPDIRHNDVILIKQSQDWNQLSGQICAVRIDGSITLKKLSLDAAQKLIVLISLNEEYKPIIVKPEDHQDINLIGYLYFLFRKLS